ncbi:MAG: hypothetical protein LLG37_03300, partial [Spirochaetia bacterium]|nr:hypothetical protein [Spirochaetia bacterium]
MKAKNILIALFSSVLLVFSFPNFIEKTTVVHTSFLIWIAWAPLFYLVIKAKNGKEAFFTGFSIAASFYLVSLYWLCNVKPMGNFAYVAWLLLCAYYGTLTGISAWAVRKLKGRPGIGYILSAPVIFTLAEFVREWAFSGWPVLTPAQSQHQFIPALQLLKFTGISGLNFLIFSVNVIIAMYVAGEKPVMKKFEGMAWLAIFIMLLFLTAAGNMPASVPSTTVKAALLQPNIDQNVNWDANYREYNMKIYKSLYDKVAAEKPDIYI